MAFTAYTGTERPNTASFASVMESLMEGPSSRSVSVAATATSNPAVRTSSLQGSSTASTQQGPSSFSSVPSSARSSASSALTPTSISGTSGTIANISVTSLAGAAATADGSNTRSDNCNNIACSPGLQAAIAVPIVVIVLAIVGLVVFLARRRKNSRRGSSDILEKSGNDQTRHLQPPSSGNGLNASHEQPVTRNVDQMGMSNIQAAHSAAPCYKDALHPTQDSQMAVTGAAIGTGGLAGAGVRRSESGASAPPPYGPDESALYNQVLPPVVIVHDPVSEDVQDPFADGRNAHGSSPFRDPSEDGRSMYSRPPLSRNSSMQTGRNADDASSIGGSDNGSIRQAQIGRHVSVASTGRVTHIRNSSYSNQSPPKTPNL